MPAFDGMLAYGSVIICAWRMPSLVIYLSKSLVGDQNRAYAWCWEDSQTAVATFSAYSLPMTCL